MTAGPYACAVVGASFAGLACARALQGRRVLLLDRRPIGDGETSACAAPLRTVHWLGGADAVREVQHTVGIYARGRRHEVPLPEPYCTFDYRTLCERLATSAGADFLQARVTGGDGGHVRLADGRRVDASFVVDAAGWRRALDPAGPLASEDAGLSYGAEEHVSYPDALRADGLHIYVRHDLVRRGYGWNFPAGDHARAGLGSFVRAPLQGGMGVLRRRDRLGRASARQGGVIPHRLRPPVAGGVLFAGDSAGHCLPLTAEGIRCAAYFGTAAGRLVAAALDGHISRSEALHRYAALHERERRHYDRLLRAQHAVPSLAPALLELGARIVGTRRVGTRITRRYLSSLRPELLPALP